MKKGKILYIYHHNRGHPLRATVNDLVYSFEKYAPHLCYYVNVAFGMPKYIEEMDFDLIIFDTLFMYKRSRPKRFAKMMERCSSIKKMKGRKVVTVQDEHLQSEKISEFINKFGINHVFSVAPHSERKKIYPDVDHQKVSFTRLLTGYLDENTVARIAKLSEENSGKDRGIDIGYRSSPSCYWLGEHGCLKHKVGELAKKYGHNFDLKIDISMDAKDTFLGDEWYAFLLRCKYTLGAESGTSVMNKDGSIEATVLEYLLKNPEASFEETREACFKDKDGEINYVAIAPRHLEACATKTCQLLVEGEYNGILEPMKHYIPIKKDFSNIKEVLRMAKEDTLREQLVEQAYQDIVASGRYTYKSFVGTILTASMGAEYEWSEVTPSEYAAYQKSKKRERNVWKAIPVTSFLINSVLSKMPKSWFLKLIKSYSHE